jgi:hypothetical protein
MEQQSIPTTTVKVKPKAKKVEVSLMRKLTSQLDLEVQKVESDKAKIAKLQKAVNDGNESIKSIMVQLSNNLAT